MKMVSSEVTYKNSVSKTKLRQHKVTIIADSFLRGIRENVELSLSNNFGTFSLVKPGCELKTLLETENSAAGSLTQKDVIFICGGSNDFNLDKVEPTTDHIVEFIKINNHTNIVLANVPLRYDLSYYSQINKGIRSYNKKLLEITKEHEQVALIEIDIDRKYTQHGLHFNKQGKLWLSNKITQAIYTILGKKLKQSAEMNEKYGIQGDASEADGRNFNQGHKDSSNNKDKIKISQNDIAKNSEERFNQEEHEITSDNSDDKNNDGKCSQINTEVVSQELQCDGEKNGVNKDKTTISEQSPDVVNNTQFESVNNIVDT
jgi:hypothetical protein